MGTIYRKYCETCNADREQEVTFTGFAGAVITDRNDGGEIIADGYLAFLKSNGELAVLPHPVEDFALREQGGTWRGATWSGRLLRVTNLICPECGAMNTTASLSTPAAGCVCGLVLAAGFTAASVWWFKLPILVEYLMIWSALFLPNVLISFYLRARFHVNARPFVFERCNCGSKKAVSVAGARNKVFPCLRCRNKSVRISIAGRS